MALCWKTDGKDASAHAKFLIDDMKQYLSISQDNIVSARMGAFEFSADALYGFVEPKYSMDASLLFDKFKKAILDTFKEGRGDIDGNRLLKIFEKDCASSLSKKNVYFLITSVNISSVETPINRVIDGCEIIFHKKLPLEFEKSRIDLISEIPNKLNISCDNDDYLYVSIKVSATEHLTAFSMAMKVFDIYRGLMQIYFVKKTRFSLSDVVIRYDSDCVLRPGNIHTLHLPDGNRAVDCYWTEDVANLSPPRNIVKFGRADENVSIAISKLGVAKRPYFDLCAKSIINYVLAISKEDLESRFMSLWLCLELITNSDDADGVIKRVTFFFGNPNVEKATLRALRKARNSQVHAGVIPLNLEMKNFRLCSFVDSMLIYLIHNHYEFDNPQDFFDFMSCSTDIDSIDKQISRLELVKKFIEKSSVDVLV